MPGQATVTIEDNQWNVLIANTATELTTGLAGRDSIPAGTGMLFILPAKQVVIVDTSQMLFPLDIIFISEAINFAPNGINLVIDIASNIQPGYVVTEETPCDMFLEVNAGEAAGIDVGDTVTAVTIQELGNDFSQIISFVLPLVALAFVFGMMGGMFKPLGSSSKRGGIVSRVPKLEPIYPERKREIPEEIEFFPDSPEFLTQTIIDIGWKEKIDSAFRDRIAKTRG